MKVINIPKPINDYSLKLGKKSLCVLHNSKQKCRINLKYSNAKELKKILSIYGFCVDVLSYQELTIGKYLHKRGYRFISRDEDNSLYASVNKPIRTWDTNEWYDPKNGDQRYLPFGAKEFSFIKHASRPYVIKDPNKTLVVLSDKCC